MATDSILTGEPEYRPIQAARLLDCSARTIRRYSALGIFPKPDGKEIYKGRLAPFWKLSTLKAFRESRVQRDA